MGFLEHHGRTLRLTLLVLTMAAVVACGGSSSASLSTVGAPIPTAADAERPASEDGDSGGELPGIDDGNGAALPAIARDDLRIVYTGSLQLVVDDLQASLAKAKAAVLATGGYIGASQESNDGDQSVATITYRIPADRWEDAIHDLRALATRVVAEQTDAAEVGGQIVDLEARIKNLRASEVSLQAIAQGTGKVSDLLEVEAQLTQVRGEIEQLEGQLARLNDQVAYGTMVATFGLDVQQVVEQAQGWDPKDDLDAATATLIGAGQAIVSGLIWVAIVWLPVVLVLVLVALIGRWAFRRLVPAVPRDPVPTGWGGES